MFSNLLDKSQSYSAKDNEDSALFISNSRTKFYINKGLKQLGNKGPRYANLDKKKYFYYNKERYLVSEY